MIREQDIRKARKELATLQEKARKLEQQIETDEQFSRNFEENDFESIMIDLSTSANERKLSILQDKISEKEQEIKVMRGLASPARIKPWTKHREEQFITAYGAV